MKLTAVMYVTFGLIGTVKALIVIPWLLRYLGEEGYGLYVLAMTTMGYAAIAALFGQETALYRFLPARIDTEDGRLLFNSTVQFVCLWLGLGLVGTGAFAVIGPLDGDMSVLLVLGALALAGLTLFSIAVAYDRCRQNIDRFMMFTIAHHLGEIAIIIAAAWYWRTVVGVMAALAVYNCLFAAAMLAPRLARTGFVRGRLSVMKRSLHFGAHSMLVQLLNSSIYTIDKYLVGAVVGLAALGYYGPAFALAGVFPRFVGVAALALPTRLSAAFEAGDGDAQLRGLRNGLTFYGALAIPAWIGLVLVGRDVLRVMTSPVLAEKGYPVCLLLSAALLLMGYGRLMTQVLMVHLQMRRVNVLLALDLAVFVILSIGLMWCGTDPALALSIAYLLVFLVSAGILLRWTKRALPGAYGAGDQARIFVASLVMVPPLPFLDMQQPAQLFGYIVGAVILYGGGLLATRAFSIGDAIRILGWSRA